MVLDEEMVQQMVLSDSSGVKMEDCDVHYQDRMVHRPRELHGCVGVLSQSDEEGMAAFRQQVVPVHYSPGRGGCRQSDQNRRHRRWRRFCVTGVRY